MTPKLCYVLTMRNDGRKVMSTVHMGTIRVDERPVIARTTVSHPSHQPFGDATVLTASVNSAVVHCTLQGFIARLVVRADKGRRAVWNYRVHDVYNATHEFSWPCSRSDAALG